MILTTHYMDEAEALCDRLAIMDHGRVLTAGTPMGLIQQLAIPSVVELDLRGRRAGPGGFAQGLGQPVDGRGDLWEIPTQDPKALLPAPAGGRRDATGALPADPRPQGHPGGRLPPPHRPQPAGLKWQPMLLCASS